MKRVVFFSGGAGSYEAAKRVAEAHGTDDLVLLFTDTLIEDADLYRFLHEGAEDVGGRLVWLKEGRDPWSVFWDERFLGNTRADPCSKILKRQEARAWVEEQCDPLTTTLYLGISWDEEHRCEAVRRNWDPYPVEFPLCDPPYLTKGDILQRLRDRGIDPPALYGLGFPHNNCGGACIKAGQAHWKLLLETRPATFQRWEENEQEFREEFGDVSILRDRRGGETNTLTLRQLRERVEGGEQCDLLDWGGCGCFVDVEE